MAPDLTDAPGRRPGLAAVAERWWRLPLVFAAIVFAACGFAHALGHTDLVFHLVIVGLASSAVAIPLGLLGLRHRPADQDRNP